MRCGGTGGQNGYTYRMLVSVCFALLWWEGKGETSLPKWEALSSGFSCGCAYLRAKEKNYLPRLLLQMKAKYFFFITLTLEVVESIGAWTDKVKNSEQCLLKAADRHTWHDDQYVALEKREYLRVCRVQTTDCGLASMRHVQSILTQQPQPWSLTATVSPSTR